MKTAVVVGSEGQDGRLTTSRLLDEGTRVIGVGRTSVTDSEGDTGLRVDVGDAPSVLALVERTLPDELYYLAAVHGSSQSNRNDEPALLRAMTDTHVVGLANVLEAAHSVRPDMSIIAASSSRVFGTPPSELQNESTPIAPGCLYGITKAAALHLGRYYRTEHGVHVSSAIFYNHESPLRGAEFVSQKVVRGALAITRGETSELVLGDLDAEVDWGWAPDYVEAMIAMARHTRDDDYVVAMGESHSVREFVGLVFELAGIEPDRHVRVDPSLLGRRRKRMIGDTTKLTEATGWRPSTTFPEMVRRLWLAVT